MQSAFVVQTVPAAPLPPATQTFRGDGSVAKPQTWQVCVAPQVVTSGAVLCGFTTSQPGSVPPSGASGVPPSTLLQFRPAASDTVANATLPFLISCATVPCPMMQPRLLATSTVKSMLPVSLPVKPTDSVLVIV